MDTLFVRREWRGATAHVDSAEHAERAWYRAYERQRRLRLARTILPISVIIELLLFVLSTLLLLGAPYTSPAREITIAVDVIEGLCVLAYGAGVIFARRERVNLAVACVLVPASVTIMLPVLAYDLADLLSPSTLLHNAVTFLTLMSTLSTLALIVLVSVLTASRWMTVGATLVMNAFSLLITLFASGMQTGSGAGAGAANATLSPFVEFAILTQWTVGGILAVTAQTQRATLRELESTQRAYERSRQLEELKEQFITHINHEVRSPVMALQGYIDLLHATAGRATPAQRDEYVSRAKRAADTLVALVRSTLNVRASEQATSQLDFQAVDLRAAVRAAAELIDAKEAGSLTRVLRVRLVPADLAVWGDPTRLRQILMNLLSNAVKYSAPGTSIEITAWPLSPREQPSYKQSTRRQPSDVPDERPRLILAVRDHGHGIPPAQIPLLFERFVRLPRDLASEVPGNGLGLYLCRTFAEAMDGRIWVESTGVDGEGTTFYVELLAASPPTRQSELPTSSDRQAKDRVRDQAPEEAVGVTPEQTRAPSPCPDDLPLAQQESPARDAGDEPVTV